MARPRSRNAATYAGVLACMLVAGAWRAGDASTTRDPRFATIVRITDLGLERPTSDSVRILVWATGPARVGVGDAELAPLTDTLRLSALPTITADVSDADVHIQLVSPGRMRLGAEVSGGRALRFTATGRHVVVLKGGTGANTITDP